MLKKGIVTGLGYLLAAVFLFLAIYIYFSGRARLADLQQSQIEAAVTTLELAEVVRFTNSLELAKRMAADVTTSPLFRAGVNQSIDQDLEFINSDGGQYRLLMQMSDTPFISQQQTVGEFLEVVQAEKAIGQTFSIDTGDLKLGGVKVKLAARSIITGQPAEAQPDAPLTATLYDADEEVIGEFVLPPEQAGLNDNWRWVTFPFEQDLGAGSGRVFRVEFTSAATSIGWALSRVSDGFNRVADHYPDGELFNNGQPGGADLTFAVLSRSNINSQPEISVDEVELIFNELEDEPGLFLSQAIDLVAGVHLLNLMSSNPHLGFYRFIWIPDFSEQAEDEEEVVSTTPPEPRAD